MIDRETKKPNRRRMMRVRFNLDFAVLQRKEGVADGTLVCGNYDVVFHIHKPQRRRNLTEQTLLLLFFFYSIFALSFFSLFSVVVYYVDEFR